jgi:hypothetical protein
MSHVPQAQETIFPQDDDDFVAFLEPKLVGTDLPELVDALSHRVPLREVLGDSQSAVLAAGLRMAPLSALREHVLRHPRSLFRLQDLVYTKGGPYWDQVKFHRDIAVGYAHLATVNGKITESLQSTETEPALRDAGRGLQPFGGLQEGDRTGSDKPPGLRCLCPWFAPRHIALAAALLGMLVLTGAGWQQAAVARRNEQVARSDAQQAREALEAVVERAEKKPPEIAGTWFLRGDKCTITRTSPDTYELLDPGKFRSSGRLMSNAEIHIFGGTKGIISNADGRTTIDWSNGTRWDRPDLTGIWYVDDRPCRILETDSATFTFINEKGEATEAKLVSATKFDAGEWGQGEIFTEGAHTAIRWLKFGGTQWTRPNLAGTYYIGDNRPCRALQTGPDTFTFINEKGEATEAKLVSATKFDAGEWGQGEIFTEGAHTAIRWLKFGGTQWTR